jgi:hypothetical protein
MDLLMEQTDPDWWFGKWIYIGWNMPMKIPPIGSNVTEKESGFPCKRYGWFFQAESIEVGEGIIDFEQLFKLPDASGVIYYIVELEDYRTTSLAGVEVSLGNLKSILAKA